jgi:hypothetical protein
MSKIVVTNVSFAALLGLPEPGYVLLPGGIRVPIADLDDRSTWRFGEVDLATGAVTEITGTPAAYPALLSTIDMAHAVGVWGEPEPRDVVLVGSPVDEDSWLVGLVGVSRCDMGV